VTEGEWTTCADAGLLLSACRERGSPVSERKLRLFASACVCHIWDRLPDNRCRQALMVGERLADGEVGAAGLAAARQAVWAALQDVAPEFMSPEEHAIVAAWYTLADSGLICFAAANRSASCLGAGKAAEEVQHAVVFRDIVGNPFRPVAVLPAWQSSTVAALARGIYDDRAFDRLPSLADALMDAGCDDPDILAHCRSEGPHVRGCWVVDLVLGKA
jgi:hypothetical protein